MAVKDKEYDILLVPDKSLEELAKFITPGLVSLAAVPELNFKIVLLYETLAEDAVIASVLEKTMVTETDDPTVGFLLSTCKLVEQLAETNMGKAEKRNVIEINSTIKDLIVLLIKPFLIILM